jgi:hypothetical protein
MEAWAAAMGHSSRASSATVFWITWITKISYDFAG